MDIVPGMVATSSFAMRSPPQRLKPHAIDIRVKIDRMNVYRVLLTRARQGTVVFVPPGGEARPDAEPGLL
jgi:hypothetical protein